MHPTDMIRENHYSRETTLNNEPPILGGKNLLINYFDDSISQNSIVSQKNKFKLNKEQYN